MDTATNSRRELSKEAFAQAVLEQFRSKGWLNALDYDAADFSISLKSPATKLTLDASYKDWINANNDDARQQVVERLVSTAVGIAREDKASTDFSAVSGRIYPTVRSRTYIENIWMSVDPKATDNTWMQGAHMPLNDAITMILVIESDTSLAICTSTMLKEWGKSFQDVLPVAMSNLDKRALPQWTQIQEGLYKIQNDDDLICSGLLRPDLFAGLAIQGELTIAIPTRTAMFAVGSDAHAATRAFAENVENVFRNDSHALSCAPFCLRSGKWQIYDGAKDQRPSLDRLRTLRSIADYSDQLQILNPHLKAVGRNSYVGQLDAITDGDKLVTWASLVDGIETLLPECDIVIMAPADLKQPFDRRFKDVMTVCKDAVMEPNTWPPLYIFPNGLTKTQSLRLHQDYSAPPEFPDVSKHGS